MKMASSSSSRKWPHENKIIVIILMFILFLTCFPSNSAETILSRDGDQGLKNEMKMVLGSSPPRCVNRCLSCRPCTATLVASPHRQNSNLKETFQFQGDESYYLLSWKCICRNKLFHP